jgi:hypothetical protein
MEITSGLKGGETVVIEGNYALPDEAKVEVSEDEENKSDANEEKTDNPTKKGDER